MPHLFLLINPWSLLFGIKIEIAIESVFHSNDKIKLNYNNQ